MKRKNLTLVFNHFEQEHLGKDVFLVPYYLGKQLDYDVTIVYRATETNKQFPEEFNGVKLVPLKIIEDRTLPFYKQNVNNLKYIVTHANNIDLLMCFHHDRLTELRVCLYKLFNPRGRAYVKLDLGELVNRNVTTCKLKKLRWNISKFKVWCWDKLEHTFLNKVDFLSCETTNIYNQLKESSFSHYKYNDKLLLMPNGFDEELLKSYKLEEKEFFKKENLFITVGRLGTPQKNTEMILKALEKVKMKDWKFYLIGPIEDSFKKIIDEFYIQNPDKRESVRFLGPIYDKKVLWEYYNKSKVFVLTSRWEGSPIVFPEAKRFKNYILSTKVNASEDITENGKYGSVIEQEHSESLVMLLQEIVDGEINIDIYKDFDPSSISWEHQIQKLSMKIKDFL